MDSVFLKYFQSNICMENEEIKNKPQKFLVISGKVINSLCIPIPCACVKITDSLYNPIVHAYTDKNGYFKICYMFPENICILVAKFGYKTSNKNLNINNDAIKNTIEIILSDEEAIPNILTGYVKNQLNKPLSFIQVYLKSCFYEKKEYITYTDENGLFILNNINRGYYYILFTSPFFYTCYFPIYINYPHIYKLKTVYLRFKLIGGTINGVISDKEGLPVKNAVVVLYSTLNNSPIKFTYTNNEGVYLFYNIKVGTYFIVSK